MPLATVRDSNALGVPGARKWGESLHTLYWIAPVQVDSRPPDRAQVHTPDEKTERQANGRSLKILPRCLLVAQMTGPGAPRIKLVEQVDQADQETASAPASSLQTQQTTNEKAQTNGASSAGPNSILGAADSEGKQPKRILWIIPNYRSVSANAQLPPESTKDKFWLATQDSFDYSSFVLAGILAGEGQASNATPQFRQGAAGYGRYYWHSFVDQASGNYFTEAIVPTFTHEDPRYYTLGHGRFFRRTGYAVSRLLITRTDSDGSTFNFSEIVGNGAGAGVSNLYYPSQERTWTKTGQKWPTQVAVDGVFNIFKEFWPDINRTLFRGHY